MAEKIPEASDGPGAERHGRAGNAGRANNRGRPSTQATGEAVRDDLAQALADLARQLQRQTDPRSVMNIIVSAVPGTIPGAEDATVSLVQNRRRVLSEAFTSDRARRFDQLQQELQQGPCLDAMYQQQTVRVSDLATDPRWPLLAARATEELGVASMLSIQLFVDDNDVGALNVLARRPRAFTDESERVGLLFASHPAIAVADAQDLTHVATALASRDSIAQAKGILMERYKITAPMAFALLAKTSQDTNRKLTDIAERLTQTGLLGD
ncbi:GAF and ANTAR domain-containing protein [Trujillonella humicola]|uniref:GAF and ANTAR domain-containing protein n=1 Tax=Trujillonella humicola TaxID=3383699 RepID=UPI003905EDB1